MQVFNVFFKVINKNKAQLIVFFAVFIGVTIMVTNINGPMNLGFSEYKSSIALFNEDVGSPLVAGLREYLSQKAYIKDIEDNQEKLQDALFFRRVEYILRVPTGFTDRLIAGEKPQIQKTTIPDSTSGIYLDMLINKYLYTAQLYMKNTPELTMDEIVAKVNADLTDETTVQMTEKKTSAAEVNSAVYFFNYFAYAIYGILILGVSTVMLTFNQSDLKRRNLCSPVRSFSMNLQLILGNLSLAIFTWLIMVIVSFVLFSEYMVTVNAVLLLLNSFVFTIAALSISFLIANIIKSKGAVSAASNVVALGCSFLSGVFVPQYLLGKSVLTIASFNPTYWYVKANNDIGELVSYSFKNLAPIYTSMLIVFGFAVAILAVTLVIMKQRRTNA